MVGETPNLAARLQALAQPGQLVIAGAVVHRGNGTALCFPAVDPTGERYPPLALSAAQQRRLTLAALLDQLEALARQNLS